MNNKELYNKIIESVSKEVKKSLNEDLMYDYHKWAKYVAIEFHGDWHLYHYDTIDEVVNAYDIKKPSDLHKLERLNQWESLHIKWGDEGWGAEDIIIIKV